MTGPRTANGSPKASWPLVTVAALSFIPSFGFLFAAAGFTWALVTDRPRARLAGILSVSGALMQFVYAFALLGWLGPRPEMIEARRITTQKDLTKVVIALEEYHSENHRYPASLRELVGYPVPTRFLNILDTSTGFFGLKNEYVYLLAADGGSYDLYGRGVDGKAGTVDDIRPRLTDSLATHSGYRPAQ